MSTTAQRTATMSPRERWLAAVRMKPVDRLPFWPKLGPSYLAWQDPPFREMTVDEVHAFVGSDRHVGGGSCVRVVGADLAEPEVSADRQYRRTVFRSAGGGCELQEHFDTGSQAWHPIKHPVESVDDVALLISYYDGLTAEVDRDALERSRARCAEIGDDAVTTYSVGTTPLMYWVEHLAGIERAHWLLADDRDAVEALFDSMLRLLKRRAEIAAEYSPVDLIYLMENTSTTLISPAQYGRYCLGPVRECAEIVNASGKATVLHMCGHLKALLPMLSTLPVAAFEAFTSPTVGNTTYLDGRAACPDVCLIGGTNATLWTAPAEAIIAQIKIDLDELPHHRGIVVTSAGVMPPLCRPETIRRVGDWAKKYPARM